MSNDAIAMMQYDANKKSPAVAVFLCLFLGYLGAHRFYMHRGGAGIMLGLWFIGIVTCWAMIGFVPLAIVAIWSLADLFCVSDWVAQFNTNLAVRLSGQEPRW